MFGMSKQFDELSNFILNEMRMSHIYQPVMCLMPLENKNTKQELE